MRQSFDHCQCFAITHLQHQVCVRLTLVWSVLRANLSRLLLYIVLDAVLICTMVHAKPTLCIADSR